MKIFLVIVMCFYGECENYILTDPIFDSKEECKNYSNTVVEKITQNFPDSSGTTFCFDEKELLEISNDLMRQEHEFWQEPSPSI